MPRTNSPIRKSIEGGDEMRDISEDAEAIIDAVPRAVEETTSPKFNELKRSVDALTAQVTKQSAFLEAFVSLANGCVFRTNRGV